MSQPEALRITVKWDSSKTSANRHRGASIGRAREWARFQAEARRAARSAWILAGEPRLDCPVRVSLLVRRGRVMDLGNIVGGCKPLMDGIFTNAVTPDDSPKWVAELGGVKQIAGKEWKGKEEVVFIIEPIEDGNGI